MLCSISRLGSRQESKRSRLSRAPAFRLTHRRCRNAHAVFLSLSLSSFPRNHPPPPPHNSPESVLIKRKAQQKLQAQRKETKAAEKAARKERRSKAFKRAEAYVKEYRSSENALIRARRVARNAGNFYREPESKLAFVIRIRGIIGVPPKVRKILQLLRLRQIHNGVFVKLNKVGCDPIDPVPAHRVASQRSASFQLAHASQRTLPTTHPTAPPTQATINMLRMVEPYIAYGYPNLKTVRDLMYKRGHGKINKQRIALSDNKIIEDNLGDIDIICMEDLIHEIFTVGANFKFANKFLYPFKLSSPSGGFTAKLLHFNEGGDAGNRMEEINALVRRMI